MLLEIENLRVRYNTIYGPLVALESLSLKMDKGESVAIVGESGSGKSTLGLAIVRLLPPNAAYETGSIRLDGTDVTKLTNKQAVSIRGTEVFMIFQDPLNTLNPVKRIGVQMIEALRTRYKREGKSFDEATARKEAIASLADVRLADPEVIVDRYPHQLSGGQIQRVVISIGLLLRPKLLIADEPTSALDVTIQAQVLKLISDLRKDYGMAVLFITHDISVAHTTADKFMVMYGGQISELGAAEKVVKQPLHPYTQALVSSIPRKSRKEGLLVTIPGSPPNMLNPPKGCRFNPRCPHVMDVCKTQDPGFTEKDDRVVRCWLYE